MITAVQDLTKRGDHKGASYAGKLYIDAVAAKIKIYQELGFVEKVAEESNVTVKQGIPDWLPDAEKALKKKNK